MLAHSVRTVALAVLLTSVAACDRVGEIVIVPEFDLAYSFESGLEAWVGQGIDLGTPAAQWSASHSAAASSEGNGAAELALDNTSGSGKVWIERELEVQPGRAYEVQLIFDFGTADGAGVEAWRIVAGAHREPPETAAELAIQDATSHGEPDMGIVFVEKSYTTTVTADEDGYVYLVLGVWGTTEGDRTYYFDNVRALLTRGSIGS